MTRNIIFSSFFALLFFIFSLFTISDYNISWDEILHFSRGQVYLNYFLTGSKYYPQNETRKSFFQIDYQAGDFWFNQNPGHPPVSDILAASFNKVFYQGLNILSDISSYHLFNILMASLVVYVVVYFSLITLGKFAAIISFLALSTYPLFWAEGHFNVKDIPEAAFISLAILAFYLALNNKNTKALIYGFIFFGLGLGTKFNIIFLPLIFTGFLSLNYRTAIYFLRKNWSYVIVGSIFALGIFFLSWPYLWNNFPKSFLSVLNYYKNIGTGSRYQPNVFFVHGFNIYPLLWIFFTSPPVALLLSGVGILASLKTKLIPKDLTLLWLGWLIIPILRVSLPGTSVYGGSRQFLEFLPAFALFAGLGAYYIFQRFREKPLVGTVLTLLFIYPVFVLVKLHPYENVYFNSFIGGLRGAKFESFPSWGNSYGNAYLGGILWLNDNAEKGAKVALIQGTEPNAPSILFRKDIYLENENWSGFLRNGEYLMDLTFSDTGKANNYTWEYVEEFLNPVYELKVDGVAILKIWRNDLNHTKQNKVFYENQIFKEKKVSLDENLLTVDLKESFLLSHIKIDFINQGKCTNEFTGFVETSKEGKNWVREKDIFPAQQLSYKFNSREGEIDYYFAGREARLIRFDATGIKDCGRPTVSVFTLNPK